MLTTSAAALSPGSSVTVTAAIRPALLLLGSVTFTDTTDKTVLGSVSPGLRCLLSINPCLVSITVPATSLTNGANTISGRYSGDLLDASSTGTVSVFLNYQVTNSQGQTTTYCSGSCDTGTQTSSDGTTSLSISANAGPSASITESFSTRALPCSTLAEGPIGDVAVFSSTGLTGNKTILYQVSGELADELESIYFGGEHLCYDSNVEFTTAGGTPAAPDGSGGYYGLLPQCTLPSGGEGGFAGDATNPPCVDFSEYFIGSPDLYTEQFETTASDPRASN